MKAIVTGGVGFVGYNLIKRLLEDSNWDIVSIDNYSTGTSTNEIDSKRVKYYNADLVNVKDYSYFMDNPDVIFHLAANARIQPSLKNPREYIKNNLISTVNILEYARQKNCQVIYSSSSSVGHADDKYANPYTLSKSMCEDMCVMYRQIYNLDSSIARFYNVYGDRMIGDSEFGTVLGIWLDRYERGLSLKITGTGEQRRAFTHVDDIVDGLLLMFEKDTPSWPVELGTMENHSLNELVELFDNATVEYIPRPEGEMETTWCPPDRWVMDGIGWSPKRNVKEFLKSKLQDIK